MIRSLLIALALLSGSLAFPARAASAARGWEEQSWRSAFLGQQERWSIASKVSTFDAQGKPVSTGALILMRAGLTRHDDPAVDLVMFVPEGAPRQWFLKSADTIEFYQDKDGRKDIDEATWWKQYLTATSSFQWMSWLAALPTQPATGHCRFHQPKEVSAVLFSRCTWEGDRITWSNWGEMKVNDDWSMWVPLKIEVKHADGSRVLIETAAFEVRIHGEGERQWPFAVGNRPRTVSEPEVPLEELDYNTW